MSKKRIRAHAAYYSDASTLYTDRLQGVPGQKFHVLPATAEAYEQMIKQAGNDLANADANDRCSYDEMVRAVAKSWGITPPKKGRT